MSMSLLYVFGLGSLIMPKLVHTTSLHIIPWTMSHKWFRWTLQYVVISLVQMCVRFDILLPYAIVLTAVYTRRAYMGRVYACKFFPIPDSRHPWKLFVVQ